MIEFILYFSKTIVITSIFMFFIWILYLMTHKPAIVDVAWSIGIAIAGYIYLNAHPTTFASKFMMLILVLWAIRLSGFIFFTRILQNKPKARHGFLQQSFCSIESINYFINYQVQGILFCFVAIPLYFTFKAAINPGFLFVIGTIITFISVIGETLADFDLYRFKKIHPKSLYDKGLWQYSRHPNYFFELLIWTGFAISGIQALAHVLIFISPIILYSIMHLIILPPTEKYMTTKYQAFKDYKNRTNKFLPLPWSYKTIITKN